MLTENNPIPPELQLPPPFHDGNPLNPIPAENNPIPPELQLPPPLHLNCPPFHPCPFIIKKTSIKDLERKDKQIKKSKASLEIQLNKLMFEKAHIQSFFKPTKMISCKQWKIITPSLLLPPVLHLHQGITLKCHCQFHLDLPFSKVWLVVSYHLYQQTIHGHGVTVPTVPTHCIIVPLVMVGQMNVIMTLFSSSPVPYLGMGHPPPSTLSQTPS